MEQRFLLELEGRLAGRLFFAEGEPVAQNVAGGFQRSAQPTVEPGPLTIKFGTGMSRSFYEWVGRALNPKSLFRRNGSVISLDSSSKPTSHLEFIDALITDLEFPDLDATSSKDAMIKAVVLPERVKVKAVSPVNLGVYTSSLANTWTVNNFRFSIDGIHSDCAQVKRIQGLRMKQGIKKFYVGEDRFPSIAPAKAEFHTIRVEIPVGFGAEFMKWHSAGKDSTTSSGLERNGAIEFLAPGSRKSYFSLNLSGMGISSIAKSAHALNIDLFVQGMRLTPGGAAVK